MARQYGKRGNSKAIHHMRSAAKGIFRSTGKVATKGMEKTAKWMVTDHLDSTQHINLMELEQKIHYSLASMKLSNRRLLRRLNSTGQDSVSEVITGWMVDHMRYVLDLLWGFIWPIVSYLILTVVGIFLVILYSVIIYYLLFRLLTS